MTFSFLAAEAGQVHVCGHRGHCIGSPENTLAALRTAHKLGATSCEIDVVLTADGEIILLHDFTVDRTTNGKGAACFLALSEVKKLDAGAWFDAKFAGERVPTLSEAIALARELDIGLEVEVKEQRDFKAFNEALMRDLADPADRERVMMISFNHAHLKQLKALIPGLKTGGIAHERFSDPIVVCRSADLDELCIDLDVFAPEDARRLHEAGISIRCHAFKPATMEAAGKSGLKWLELLKSSLRDGLIDSVSGDDVAWLTKLRNEVRAS